MSFGRRGPVQRFAKNFRYLILGTRNYEGEDLRRSLKTEELPGHEQLIHGWDGTWTVLGIQGMGMPVT